MKIKNLISIILLGVMLIMSLPITAAEAEVAMPTAQSFDKNGIIVAYFNATQGYSTFEFTNIDVVNYHPASIVANGMSYTGGTIVNHPNSNRMSYYKNKALEQNPDVKFVFTVANGNINDFESWFYNANNAEKLATEMTNIIKNYGYDGLDIDYEFPQGGSNTRRNFVYFMQQMRAKLDALGKTNGKDYILSMAVPGGIWAFSLFDMVGLSQHVDYFNIMNYDLYVGSNTAGTTHHHTAPYDDTLFPGGTVNSDIALYRSYGIPDEKIVVGLGMYARRWTGVPNVNNGLHQPGTLDMNSNEAYIHYTTLKSSYENRNGYVKYWDEAAQAPYLYNASRGIFLTYDDERSAKIKCELAGKSGVRGIMVFDYCTTDGIGIFDNMRKWIDASTVPEVHEHSYTRTMTKFPGCVEEGVVTYTCSCGDSYTEAYPAIGGHMWNEWVITKEATETEDGEQQRTCRRNCGAVETEIIPALGVPEPKPELAVSSEGPNITISGMSDVKDVFIALGDYSSYRDVKDNMVVQLTTNKLAGAAEYTYTLKEGGYYTVLVRYNDDTQTFLYQQIDVTQPVYTANGLQLTVSNLADVKVIRTAYGEHKTVSAIKKAEGARAFTAKNDIKGADSYMVQYRNNGTVTVAVQYNDGYTDIYTYEVVQKVPTIEQNGNKVTFGNLDGLYNIRYAKGEWSTSSEIKKAPGAQALKASAIDENGNITVTLPTAGTYTFCVQYSDESYNYYTITVE
ncbi:MAG: glycoside hydrolase family 18 protein [Clostridia bacterium]|nr:glycoside hydrolase family 18 protein [Clostridia bacterium]